MMVKTGVRLPMLIIGCLLKTVIQMCQRLFIVRQEKDEATMFMTAKAMEPHIKGILNYFGRQKKILLCKASENEPTTKGFDLAGRHFAV